MLGLYVINCDKDNSFTIVNNCIYTHSGFQEILTDLKYSKRYDFPIPYSCLIKFVLKVECNK